MRGWFYASLLVACGVAVPDARDASADTSGSERVADDATLAQLAVLAVGEDETAAEIAISRLRAAGLDGHRALFAAHDVDVTRLRTRPPRATTPAEERLRHAIDRVSGQRDGHASGLYWFTDLDAARAEARASGRPIVSLRLLGRLDEELSCANSRYFRTLLYPDERVRTVLARDFVLFWSSERPAPHITIDMGDGRRIERTITGNSIHYVTDADGRVLDALPGLYTPEDFAAGLTHALAIAHTCTGDDATFRACVATEHTAHLATLEARWAQIARGRSGLPSWTELARARALPPGPTPSVTAAMPTTMGKMFVEQPMLDLVATRPVRPLPEVPVDWLALADTLGTTRRWDDASLALLRLKTGTDDVTTISAMLARTTLADSLANELTMHRVIDEWLADPNGGSTDVDALNARVYTEIFLTPASDPWLGLRADDVWDAIETADR